MKENHEIVSPKASFVTLGCPMNQVDSERMISGFIEHGFEIVPEEEADVIVVNTCGFIESAREESIDAILSIAELKKNGNLKAVVAAGCLAERYRDDLMNDLAEVDAVVGLSDAGRIPEVCGELLDYTMPEKKIYSRALIGYPHMAYLRISEGCNHSCSYCAIPMIRGKFRSVPEEKVLYEAHELSGLGIKELILIGQDTTFYGRDFGKRDLAGLLEKLNDVEGIEWIRLLYSHPGHFTEELIEAYDGLSKVIPYIDIPLQHISSNVLKRMGRGDSADTIMRLIDNLRDRIEGLVLRTSLIVGFPGETETDFDELADFVRNYKFERLGAFEYSKEEGTKAVSFENTVSADIARERYETIMEIQSGVSAEFQASLIGREFDMIIDELNPDSGAAVGRTYMDAPDVDGNISVDRGVEEGEAFCRVRVTGADTYDLTGEVVRNSGKSVN
ncbi:30S ribosomal protein S12 methylthiotransferase RimO [Candidatus Latescibacterota bacterium]